MTTTPDAAVGHVRLWYSYCDAGGKDLVSPEIVVALAPDDLHDPSLEHDSTMMAKFYGIFHFGDSGAVRVREDSHHGCQCAITVTGPTQGGLS